MGFKMKDLNQLIIKFDYDQNFKDQDFYVSKSNEYSFKLLNSWPKWEKNFLNLIGEKFSGKTHLINIFLKKFKGIKIEASNINNHILKEIKIYENIVVENLNIDNYKEADKLIESLKSIYENYWKSKNEINTSVKISLTISINNNDNLEISKFEEILDNTDLIYNYHIYKFNNKDNFYKIIFNGSPDNFLKIMKNKNYEFDIQNKIWSVK